MEDPSRDCIIFDIDGTIADNTHRVHHLLQTPKDWPAFHATMHLDKPITALVQLLAILHQHFAIILCTARQDSHREVTQAWLAQHAIPYTELHMGATNDFRPQEEVKLELLHTILASGWRPLFVVDDRSAVVAMWRKAGLVCLQCAPGDF